MDDKTQAETARANRDRIFAGIPRPTSAPLPTPLPSVDEGGRAFPNDGAWANGIPEGGMSLRDYFAGQALIAIVSMRGLRDALATAKYCYRAADAMIAERAKP